MKSFKLTFGIFLLLCLWTTQAKADCLFLPSVAPMSGQLGQITFEVGTSFTLTAVGCGITAGEVNDWYRWPVIDQPLEGVSNPGSLSISVVAGSTFLTGKRAWSIGIFSAHGLVPGGVLNSGIRPAKPVITASQCGYSRALRSNVARIQIGPDDNDPQTYPSMMYQLKSGSDVIGIEAANTGTGQFDYLVALPAGPHTLTARSQRAYEQGLYQHSGDFTIFSEDSEAVSITCPVVPLDDVTDDGNPDNCPSCKSRAGHPVNVASGKMWHQQNEFTLPGRTDDTALTFQRTYLSSTSEPLGDLGYFWKHNFESHLKFIPRADEHSAVIWFDESGGASFFDFQGSDTFLSPGGQQAVMKWVSDHYELKKPNNTVYFYNTYGKLSKIRDRHGEEQTLNYTAGKLSSVTAPFAGTITFTRDDAGRIITVTRERENLSYHYTYNAQGRLATATDFAGRTYAYNYVTNMEYTGAQGLLSKITDPIGRELSFTYYENGRAFQQFEPGGGTYTFNYFNDGAVVKALTSKKRHFRSALPKITHTQVFGPDGGKTEYFFDSNLRTIKTIFADGNSVYNGWNADGYLANTFDQAGNNTVFTYDTAGNMITMKRPADTGTLGITYNLDLRIPTQITPPVGSPINYTVDSGNGDVTHVDRSDGTNTLAVDFTRDSFGRILSTNNGRTTYTDVRDANGFLTTQFDSHNPQTLTYDSRGRVATRTYLSGRVISFTYNDDDQPTLVSDSHGPSVAYTYDLMGRKLSQTVSDGHMMQLTAFEWDAKDRLVSEKDALGNTTKYFYDQNRISNVPVGKVDALGRTTRYEYDILSRLIRTVDPTGASTSYQYDSKGQLAIVTDALGYNTSYNYDGNGRKVSELRPSARTIGSVTTPATTLITYAYSDSDKLVSETHHSGSGGDSVLYEYDLADRVTKKTLKKNGENIEDEALFTYENQLDAALKKTVNNSAANLGFTHEAAPPFAITAYSVAGAAEGNPLGILADSFTVARDVTGNISGIAGTTAGEIYSKAYDPAGRLVGVDAGALKIAQSYDGFGRKSGLSATDGTSAAIVFDELNRITSMNWKEKYKDSVREALSYNPVGNIVALDRENASYKLGYSDDDQLVSSKFKGMAGVPDGNKQYVYDLAGNRLQSSPNDTLSTFVSNFLVSNGTSNFAADQDGFGQVAHEATGDKTKSFAYRADGRISEFQGSGLAVQYHYDGLDRLVAKTINDGSSYTQSFTHLADENRVLLGKAGDGSVTTYIDGQGFTERLGEVKGGVGKGYMTDQIGSVLNAPQAGLSRSYGVFGESNARVTLSSTISPVIYGYAGGIYNPETGYTTFGPRQLDHGNGRWTTQEPTGRDGPHLYHYVFNNPLRYVDPTGLFTAVIVGPDITDRYTPPPKRTQENVNDVYDRFKGAEDAIGNEFSEDFPQNRSSNQRFNDLNQCSERATTDIAKIIADIIAPLPRKPGIPPI